MGPIIIQLIIIAPLYQTQFKEENKYKNARTFHSFPGTMSLTPWSLPDGKAVKVFTAI